MGMGIRGKGGVWQASSKKLRATWYGDRWVSCTGKPVDVDNGGLAAAATLLGFQAREGLWWEGCARACPRRFWCVCVLCVCGGSV